MSMKKHLEMILVTWFKLNSKLTFYFFFHLQSVSVRTVAARGQVYKSANSPKYAPASQVQSHCSGCSGSSPALKQDTVPDSMKYKKSPSAPWVIISVPPATLNSSKASITADIEFVSRQENIKMWLKPLVKIARCSALLWNTTLLKLLTLMHAADTEPRWDLRVWTMASKNASST